MPPLARRIGVDEARQFWAHPSQHVMGTTPDILPDGDEFYYWACGPICGLFHRSHWPGVWMAHHGCKPEGWGWAAKYARAGLVAFWEAEKPERIIGWTARSNRAALAFAKRCGFSQDGMMALPSGDVILQGWRLECL